jgi:hypothetical protein
VSTRHPGDDPGRTYQYPPRYDDRGQQEQPEPWEDEDPPRPGDRQPAFYPAEPPERQPAFYPADPDEPQPAFYPADSDEPQPRFHPADADEPQPRFHPADADEPQPRFRPADPDEPQPRFSPAGPVRDDYGRHAAHERPGHDQVPRDDPPRRDAGNYRSPTTWNGPAGPAAPPGREPGGWYQDPAGANRTRVSGPGGTTRSGPAPRAPGRPPGSPGQRASPRRLAARRPGGPNVPVRPRPRGTASPLVS